MPGIRELDGYCETPTPENLDLLIEVFQKQEGADTLTVKILKIMLPVTITLEQRIPQQWRGDRAREDPKVLRVGLVALCLDICNRWSGELTEFLNNRPILLQWLVSIITEDNTIKPNTTTWQPLGWQLDRYLESSTPENLEFLVYYLREQHDLYMRLLSLLLDYLFSLQDTLFSQVSPEMPKQDMKDARIALLVLGAEISNRWSGEFVTLANNGSLLYESLCSALDKSFSSRE